ncbi:GyrI-like domain-containing protein [Halodesulfovibrio sp.]|jgi:DNA gyrase inhibitor GyrI|uniref:AraC family transcriptional regulator n=1 Tax=Halodesulfovibrio sp. TaxID=1912772 RepID=UPI0025CED89D|nr:GyrI-like domain-containing protein [Halodesulfovibrio sp.]MCT4628215.1 GyrI-like domain-containing protein [Halodesulfovibrio sp.]
MKVVIEKLPDIRVAAVREIGPYTISAPQAWNQLSLWIAKNNMLSQHSIFLGLRHDSSIVPKDQRRYDATVSVPEDCIISGIAEERYVSGGEFAMYTHQGKFDTLEEAWSKLYWEWLPSSGRIPADKPDIEIYLSDTTFSADKEILTRLLLPLQPI